MIFYFAIGMITVALGYMVKNQKVAVGYRGTKQQGINYICLGAIFLILFGLAALRLGVGNDYGDYTIVCHEIYVGGYVVTEIGFNWVVKILYALAGGEAYLLMFAFFAFLTVYLFLKVIYDQTTNFAMGFFLFMAFGLYFRSYNTVRYYFALALALYAMGYVIRKEYGKFLIIVGLAALFHKSVLVVIPIYVLASFPWKKWFACVIAVGSVGMLLFQEYIMKIALFLYPSYEGTIYLEDIDGIIGSLNSIGRCGLVLLFGIFMYRKAIEKNPSNQFYFQLNILAMALYIGGSFLPLVSRLGYYLISSHILLIPNLIDSIENVRRKKIVTGIVIGIGLIYFVLFLRTGNQNGVSILPYKSWLFYTEEWYHDGIMF